ncbi:MAG TPA: hypothetical protein VF540_07280, partial [Segetibacter sp.]
MGVYKKSYEAKLYKFALLRERIISFLSPFSFLFKSSTRSVFSNACSYVQGLFCAKRSNCQQIADVSDDANQQRLHHLLSKAKWEASSLMDEVAVRFVKQI